jgi:putative phosphoribosyl transferase
VVFRDRIDAGRRLAGALAGRYLGNEDVVVLGLPRGGVPVAFEVAKALGRPLDIIMVRKLGVPFQPEFAMGAIGEGGVRIINRDVLQSAQVTEPEFVAVEARERTELERRSRRYRGDRPPLALLGRTAVVVDDGIATGSTARAACQVARALGAERVVMAAPVASRSSLTDLANVCDEVVCLEAPEPFYAVGEWYRDFSATSDAEVEALLQRAAQGLAASPAVSSIGDDPPVRDEEVDVHVGPVRLAGHFTVPEVLRGMVIFAHGSGSSHHSARNRFVASTLNGAGLGTLLFDLLSPDEEIDRAQVFDIPLLASRLTAVTNWLQAQPEAIGSKIGYFGASTGAAAALWAAAEPGADVGAIVSRGGRPDLASAVLAQVRAPTLLIVGKDDKVVLDLNRKAQGLLHCQSHIAVVPGATHLFEEPGALDEVAHLASDWFLAHLSPRSEASQSERDSVRTDTASLLRSEPPPSQSA